jgi:hypothetical protein
MRNHGKNEALVNSTGLNNTNALRNSEYLRNVAYGGNKTTGEPNTNQTSQKQIAKSTQNLKQLKGASSSTRNGIHLHNQSPNVVQFNS